MANRLGCMGISAAYGSPKAESDMIALVHDAIDSGVTFLDTSDVYGPPTNEILLGKALSERERDIEYVTDVQRSSFCWDSPWYFP